MKKIIFLFFLTLPALAQRKPLVFREVWVWEYMDKDGKRKELPIYHIPAKNYWLFTTEALENAKNDLSYILAKPDGEYLLSYSDSSGHTGLTREKIVLESPRVLPLNYKLQKKTQLFGEPEMGYSKVIGKLYLNALAHTSEASEMYFTDTKSDMRPVYHFNSLNSTVKLPINFPSNLPAHTLVLEEKFQGQTTFTFKYKSHTEYYIYKY